MAALATPKAPRKAHKPKPSVAEAAAADVAPLSYDLALLHQTAHGSKGFIYRILASFHANTPGNMAELRAAYGAADWPAVAALTHKLKPSLRLLGAAGLAPSRRHAGS